jgi:signal transduction histidine kinase
MMEATQGVPRILYVEDDPVARLLVQRVLAREGYEILEAADGLSGIEIARRQRPDLVLMDINIPDMDGYAVTTRLKSLQETHDIPVIALTVNVMLGDRERSLAAGCDGYIPKPIDVDALPGQIAAFLEGKRERVADGEKVERLEEHTRRLVDRLEQTIIELRDANAKLRRMEKVKSDFIVLAGHELRTPLTLIYGYSRLLLSTGAEKHLSPDVQHMLEQVAGAAGRLSSVVDDIINVALIDADQLELSFDPLDLGKLTHSVIEQFEQAIQERRQRLEVAAMEGLPPILGDAKYLGRAVGNVIGNAIKFTPDGGLIEVWCQKVRDPLQGADKWLDLIVRDSGIGIDRDEQECIFDKFYVLENTDLHSTSRTGYKGGGLGLGLSVVRGIFAAHGGRVFVESGGGGGGTSPVGDLLQGGDRSQTPLEGGDQSALPGSTFHMILPLDFNPHQLETRKE